MRLTTHSAGIITIGAAAANDSQPPSLTRREIEVLELVASGNSAKEAGGLIGIAPRTVERYIENIRLKLGARNRAHMIARAIALGLLELDPVQPSQPGLFDNDRHGARSIIG